MVIEELKGKPAHNGLKTQKYRDHQQNSYLEKAISTRLFLASKVDRSVQHVK